VRLAVFLLVLAAFVLLWDAGWWLAGVPPMSPPALKRALAGDTPPTVIDVRTPAEFEFFRIPGAVNVPYPADLIDLARVAPDPSAPVVVVCMTGHRSPPTVRQMQRGGYTNVRNLTGGMLVWKLFGGPTVSGDPDSGPPEPGE
jgi:rhodanese-related sulfurtransferase